MSNNLVDYRKLIPEVQRALDGGSSIRGAARDLGVPEGTIRQWIMSGRVITPTDPERCQNGEDSDTDETLHGKVQSTIVDGTLSHKAEDDDAAGLPSMTERECQDYQNLKTLMVTTAAQWYGFAVEIRDRRLYRGEYRTFREFLALSGTGGKASRFYQIEAADRVASNVTAAGLPAPANEAQARALAALPPEQQPEAWQKANESSGGKPTARDVEKAAAEVSGKPARNGRAAPPDPEPEPEIVEESVTAEPLPVPGTPAPSEDELDDDAWLERIQVRAKLAPGARARFDHDAILFRHAEPLVSAFADKVRPVLNHAKKETGHQGVYHNRVVWFLKTEHPKYWEPCPECPDRDGLSCGVIEQIGKCPKCHGEGYRT